MTCRGDALLYTLPTPAGTVEDKVFVVPAAQVAQFNAFRERHDTMCPFRGMMLSPAESRYTYHFREVGGVVETEMSCSCGTVFCPDDDII